MMRKISTLMLCLTAVASTFAATKADTLTVRIERMHCDHCAHNVRNLLTKGEGVERVTCNLERRTATIAYNAKKVSPDTLCARLAASGRYLPAAYSPSDVILRQVAYRIDDMHCKRCEDRIAHVLQPIAGIDSVGADLEKHTFTVRYDANKTSKSVVREKMNQLGFTPVTYYDSPKVDYAYYELPEGKATEETKEELLVMDNVADVNVNARRNTMAVAYVVKQLAADKLLEDIRKAGVEAKVPAPHECKEEAEN